MDNASPIYKFLSTCKLPVFFNKAQLRKNAHRPIEYSNMKRILSSSIGLQAAVVFILVLASSSCPAATYFVSPTGDDGADGLTELTAWKSITNGESEGLITPGDTVFILPGTFNLSESIHLTFSGSHDTPIVYIATEKGSVLIDVADQSFDVVILQGNFTIFDGIEVCNGQDNGIRIQGAGCQLTDCRVHDIGKDGIVLENNEITIYRCVVWSVKDNGIRLMDPVSLCRLFNNTVTGCSKAGIEMKNNVRTTQLINNISAKNKIGIKGHSDNTCEFNDVWGNSDHDYDGGVFDSGGGISVDPMFADTSSRDYSLLEGSLAIDAGLDIGYSFSGSAPDMGAIESEASVAPSVYYVSTFGDDANDGLSEAAAWATLDNGDELGILVPGDSVKVLPGEYVLSEYVLLSQDGTFDQPITYCKALDASPHLDCDFWSQAIVYMFGNHTIFDGFKLSDANWDGIHVGADSCVIRNCYLYNMYKDGIDVGGSDYPATGTLVMRNIVDDCGEDGIEVDVTAPNTLVYNNTVHDAYWDGIYITPGMHSARVFNNISVFNYTGISAQSGNACGFNDFWSNTYNYYNGIADSAGGVSVKPSFVDRLNGDFHLGLESEVIDAGLDLGFPFEGSAPDMGAFELPTGSEVVGIVVSPDTATVAEGGSLQFTAVEIAMDSTVVSDVTSLATWSTTDPSGSISGDGLYRAGDDLSPPSYLVIAEYEAFADTAVVNVVSDGSLHFVRVELEDGTPLGDTIITTDDDGIMLYCRGYDSGQNLLGDQLATWSLVVPDEIGSLSPVAGASTSLELTTPGTSRVIAAYSAEIADTSGLISCTAGLPATIEIAPSEAIVSLDSTLQFSVCSSDADGNPSNPEIVPNWSVLDGIGSINADGLFTPTSIGDGRIVCSGAGLSDTTGMITVTPGNASAIVIVPDSVVVSADSTQEFALIAYDIAANETDPGTVTWGLTEEIGTIDESGLFDAVTAGFAKVIATSEFGLVDTSSYLEVVPGVLSVISVSPDRDTVSADSTIQFSVSGIDADGNEVSEFGGLTWSVTGDIGTIDNLGLFTAVTSGDGFISVASDLGVSDVSDTITVIPGSLAYLDVLPATNLIMEGTSYQYSADGFDSDSNLIAEYTDSVLWSTSDPSGSMTTGGLYTSGTDISPPDYFVKASYGMESDSGRVTVLTSGSLSYVRVELENGSPVNDTILTTDNDSTVVHCRGYDSANNLLGDFPVTWLLIGSDSIGHVNPGPATSTNLMLSRPGQGRIVAYYSAETCDTTGVITCTTGVPINLVVSPDTATISADETIQFTSALFDADNNEIPDDVTCVWDVIGDIGGISSAGLMTASTPGEGFVVCEAVGLYDTTGVITVLPGEVAYLEVLPDSASVTVGGTVDFEVVAMDSDSNAAGVPDVIWEFTTSAGVIDGSGTFTALDIGTGRVVATTIDGMVSDTNSIVTVTSSSLRTLVVTPDTASLSVGGSALFEATGFDQNYEPASVGELSWEVIGDIGSIDESGHFIAHQAGFGKITVTSSINNVSDTTDFIIVDVPTVTAIPLGAITARPMTSGAPVLGFKISNAFDEAKSIQSITINNSSRGAGNESQILSNLQGVSLSIDTNNDEVLDSGDSVIAVSTSISSEMTFDFSPVVIAPAAEVNFFAGVQVSERPRDDDSLDFYIRPATGLVSSDNGPIAGVDSLNSMGFTIIDGMVAGQVGVVSLGNSSVDPGTTFKPALTFNLPRNGYSTDSLTILSVYNAGNAKPSDIDSLMLFVDDGNGVFQSGGSDRYIGNLAFTGGLWSISGLSEVLSSPTTRYHLVASIAEYPTNGATISLGIPVKGVEVASGNDGPIDAPLQSIDTMLILSSEMLAVNAVSLSSRALTPGESTGPLVGLLISNTTGTDAVLDSLIVTLFADDPDGASVSELGSQLVSVSLWKNLDDDFSERSSQDSLIGIGSIQNGSVTFDTDALNIIGNGGTAELFIETELDTWNAKDGNTINFGISSASDLFVHDGHSVAGAFPIKNDDDYTINAFPASAVTVNEIDGATLFGGQSDEVVLDFELPADGYDEAELSILQLENKGAADERTALEIVKVWADRNDDGAPSAGELIGSCEYGGGLWTLDNASHRYSSAANRFLITVDVSSSSFEGGTLRFEIPKSGVTFESGTNGPDDRGIGNSEAHSLFPADRITVISKPLDSINVYPGTRSTQVLSFALYNGYADSRSVQSIRLTNSTETISDADFADSEMGQVSLYFDSNSDRTLDENDDIVATGYFSDNTLNLYGLDVTLDAGAISQFFITADLPLTAIDSDILALSIGESSDLSFDQQVNVNGDLPLHSGGPLRVDGSVAAQYEVLQVAARTLAPGDQTVCMMAFRPSPNGDQQDYLTSIVIRNLGDAVPGDIVSPQLWMDSNGDRSWDQADSMLGPFEPDESQWVAGGISVRVNEDPPTLFVVAGISESAHPNTTIGLYVPSNGCEFISDNDGPIDSDLDPSQLFVISGSGLRLICDQVSETYSIGQEIVFDLKVTNLLETIVSDVNCRAIAIENPELVSFETGSQGPTQIQPGDTADFQQIYRAIAPGQVSWQFRAFSPSLAESSAVITAGPVSLQMPPPSITIELMSSVPTSVTRGQQHVFPLSIKYTHPDTSGSATMLRLDSLSIKVVDESGNPQQPVDVFSRVVLATGYTNLAIEESLGNDPILRLHFDQPAILFPGETQILTLMVDIDSLSESSGFAFSLEGGDAMRFVDNNTGLSIPIDQGVSFPLITESCRIDDPAYELSVSSASTLGPRVNLGQQDVDVLHLGLRHSGSMTSAQIQVTGLTLDFLDNNGSPISASEVVDEVSLVRAGNTIGQVAHLDGGPECVDVTFNSPPVVSPGEVIGIDVSVSIRDNCPYSGFEMIVRDSTDFILRDMSSGSAVIAVTDADSLIAGSAFPMTSGMAYIMAPATAPVACLESNLPSSIVGGSDAVPLIGFELEYEAGTERSALKLKDIAINVLDSLQTPLDPSQLFDRIGVSIDRGQIEYQQYIELRDGQTVFKLGDGTNLNPGDAISVLLFADIEADAPYDHFKLMLPSAHSFNIVDETDTTSRLEFTIPVDCGVTLPFSTGLAEIYLPAGRPVVCSWSGPVRIGYPGQRGIGILDADLSYDTPQLKGDVVLNSMVGRLLKRSHVSTYGISASEVFDRVSLVMNGQVVAVDSVLVGDTVKLQPLEGIDIQRGSSFELDILCDINPAASSGNYLISFDDSTAFDISDRNLGTSIFPYLDQGGYPLLTSDLSISGADLAGSFSNYPNPFFPGRGEQTRIAFVLSENARIDLEIFTITGDLVVRIAEDSYRVADSYNDDMWSGTNTDGTAVAPGTYICRITARYDSGETETCRRKIAVIR